jgi:hypothetical protein
MISVVCVYNNLKILDDVFLKSLGSQTAEFELIPVDNTQGRFRSAAEALNDGGKRATGRYILFVHQDVSLAPDTFLEDVEKVMDSLANPGIAGVAGAYDKLVVTNIMHGDPPCSFGDARVDRPAPVQTVDECLFIIPRTVFSALAFDEKACNDWHLYAVDYSLSIKEKGYEVYVLPSVVRHLSMGVDDSILNVILSIGSHTGGYYRSLDKVLRKHRPYTGWIYTTCGVWDTRNPLIFQRIRLVLYIILRSLKVR